MVKYYRNAGICGHRLYEDREDGLYIWYEGGIDFRPDDGVITEHKIIEYDYLAEITFLYYGEEICIMTEIITEEQALEYKEKKYYPDWVNAKGENNNLVVH